MSSPTRRLALVAMLALVAGDACWAYGPQYVSGLVYIGQHFPIGSHYNSQQFPIRNYPEPGHTIPLHPDPILHPVSHYPVPRVTAHPAPQKHQDELQEVAGWTYLRFADVGARAYVPENCTFTGVTVWRDKVLIAVPRFRSGVLATLTWLPRPSSSSSAPSGGTNNSLLQPFPSWSWQQGHQDNCSGLVSVFRTRIDCCGRLWVMDSGQYPLDVQLCPPRLLVFDVDSGRLMRSVEVPPHVMRPTSLLTFIVLDQLSSNCDDTFVYITDAIAYGIVVYDAKHDRFWRFEHDTFKLNPQLSTFTVAGESTTTEDGIIALAISHIGFEKMLFYHAQAGKTLYAVPTAALKRPSSEPLPVVAVLEQSSQGVGLAADARGTIYFNPLSDTSVVAWTPSGGPRTLVQDTKRLQFLSDLTVDQDGSLWMVSNRIQSFNNGTYDHNGINLRVLRLPLYIGIRNIFYIRS